MKYLIILPVLLLSGCFTTVPVVAKFPNVPAVLREKCPPLNKLEGEPASIVDLNNVVIENYTLYHECSMRLDAWNTWYDTQKKIFDEVK